MPAGVVSPPNHSPPGARTGPDPYHTIASGFRHQASGIRHQSSPSLFRFPVALARPCLLESTSIQATAQCCCGVCLLNATPLARSFRWLINRWALFCCFRKILYSSEQVLSCIKATLPPLPSPVRRAIYFSLTTCSSSSSSQLQLWTLEERKKRESRSVTERGLRQPVCSVAMLCSPSISRISKLRRRTRRQGPWSVRLF